MAKTSSNDRTVLNALLAERKQERAPNMSDDEFFEVFVADEVLRDLRVSDSEVDSGIVDGSGDGGIDSMYTFVNGELVLDVDDIPDAKAPSIDLVVIQATVSARFKEDRIIRLSDSLDDLLELRAEPSALRKLYNQDVVRAAQIFSETYLKFAGKFPKLRVKIVYASKGAVPVPNSRLRRKAGALRELVAGKFQGAAVEFDFLGARELVELANRQPALDFSLDLSDVMSVDSNSYIALVELSIFDQLISDAGGLRVEIFDANVRDYEGSVAVNREIRATLEAKEDVEDFWWLNNGVTILATKASLAGKTLTLKDPQIVNGFQTSNEISAYLADNPGADHRTILARVLVTASGEIRDRIIRATNSQTSVGVFALRATDPLHRDLETYLRQSGLFYERRKNYYKNRGRLRARIVTVADMAQAMMATLLYQPDDSRARPSSLVKDDAKYKIVFNPDYPLDAYLNAIQILHGIRDYLFSKGLQASERNNFRFHMATVISAKLEVVPNDADSLAAVDLSDVASFLDLAYALVASQFQDGMDSGMTQDQAAKSPRITEELVAAAQ